ncbi:UDP-N-acetylmuramate dehydrogenase [uncultured Selenomonas sp.]|uniref:UDP-N-acetylmuramate dehydrogenase n=1 Tax=uncultured Selenomonas sp. TaxID=159275 RepID=UPI0025F13135|nr:UDP-N-acetylmuramate dehydrogenase [uncultured Selenomonas sp.]
MSEKNPAFLKSLQSFLQPSQLLQDEPMKLHTTFKIGGPADYLLFPSSAEEVGKILQLLKEYSIPLTILGNGSNVLVRDGGIRGAVVKFNHPMSSIRVEGTKIIAGAGALLKDVSAAAAEHGLTGMEFACGIPGSLGGAVFMNAGAYDGEMKNVVSRVRSVTMDGECKERDAAAIDLGYRHSIYQTNGEAICEVELQLKEGDKTAINAKIADFTERRETKQPLEMASAGSTFKRPTGYYAGTLIQETGLKGLTVGGAQVSKKHAGFVVNTGTATAKDVLELIHEVQRRVKEAHGVELHPEVRIIGEA